MSSPVHITTKELDSKILNKSAELSSHGILPRNCDCLIFFQQYFVYNILYV